METLTQKAKDARLTVLDMIYRAKSSHIGSNFSCIDILTVLFDRVDVKKDIVILSAGWKAAAFYYFLADKGFFPKEELLTYNQENSRLIGLTEPGVPGVFFAGGSMQMGVPAAVGAALAKRMRFEEGMVYCVLSDGELAGGMVWESFLIAKQHGLENLVFIVDLNHYQAMGETTGIINIERYLFDKISSFGFSFDYINGHDIQDLKNHLKKEYGLHVVICSTVKGKGVSFMEHNNLYHYKDLSEEEYLKAKEELQNG